jgi:redox-sensitive bicupin YhaK (pirin superfamily)
VPDTQVPDVQVPDAQVPDVQVIGPREVPLGGIRAMTVRRTLPHRDRSFVGAWCFVDHYGPDHVGSGSGGMDVAPHPHTGLQTVSWLFDGEIEHRDSGGAHGLVRPGEVNLMTAGAGIAHSEVSTPATRTLHGVQLWVALPADALGAPRGFEHWAVPVDELPGGAGTARVFVGTLPGLGSSPVTVHTPLVGAQLDLVPGARMQVPVDPTHEHALLVDRGRVQFEGVSLERGDLGCVEAGAAELRIVAAGDAPVRALLLGGAPFEEEIVMWWNFVGRSHEDIATARADWEAGSARFGVVPGYAGPVTRIPAPALPGVRLRPRGRRGRH